MKKKLISSFMLAVAGCFTAQAALIGYTNTFSSAEDLAGWTSVGTTAVGPERSNRGTDFDDGNTEEALVWDAENSDMIATGDGVQGDGVLWLNPANDVRGDEGLGYTLGGTLDLGETVIVSGSACGDSSYSEFSVQIWDMTANALLATTGNIRVEDSRVPSYVPADFSVSYTGQSTDIGHVIQVRVVDNCNNANRDIYIDNITAIPEPATLSLVAIGAMLFRWLR